MIGYKVVITDREYESIENEISILGQIGASVFPYQLKSEKDIIRVAHDCDALITQHARITKKIIGHMDRCKIIARYATGIDTIDISSATEKDICVSNVEDYCTDEVSTHAVAMLLNLNRKLPLYHSSVSEGNWDYKSAAPLLSLRDSIVGIIGFGHISAAYLRKLRPFCGEIWVHSNHAEKGQVESLGGKLKSFDEIIVNADYITIHSPLTSKTKNLFQRNTFMAMKKSAFIINVSRGGLIHEEDLIWALEQGVIAGAALDVLQEEPPKKSNKLLTMKNVMLTPHSAWYSTASQNKLQKTVAEEVLRVLSGYFPKHLVNPEVKQNLKLKELHKEEKENESS
ncbi:C-terminal binding protein [Sinanaerobacter chloroacetimidivorans]|uniref:C-terminal binding protein n=1 Tax=Sinanaerobacter chloroacetimidivorans TaxID=2818044 RepID=A0A8J7W242_9FIRM|nr:C-terminal binding protein [Sinanaerobacter chloroacetimidivorans]MBR0597840.1 C-terminal binding protein [Sinanaerobacter chloroacetimidivorans]